MSENQINVLVVEDSPVVRQLLVHILNQEPGLHVCGTAEDGEEALAFLTRQLPDVILTDIHMPKMDGFQTTRRIMETQPVPIVICSASTDTREVARTFQALDAGALALLEKPLGLGDSRFEEVARNLVETVKLMSEVKVVKRRPRAAAPQQAAPKPTQPGIKVVAIGASTGGPQVLETILAKLPNDFPVPILIVQHIAAGFLSGLAEWLTRTTQLPVHIASHGEPMRPANVYLAPDGTHMGMDANHRIVLNDGDPEGGLRPSVAYLFRSVAAACGSSAAAVLLTGMGRDGAEELKRLKDRGALTIAQDSESSVVYGMPAEAVRLGAAKHVLPPQAIAALLVGCVKQP